MWPQTFTTSETDLKSFVFGGTDKTCRVGYVVKSARIFDKENAAGKFPYIFLPLQCSPKRTEKLKLYYLNFSDSFL